MNRFVALFLFFAFSGIGLALHAQINPDSLYFIRQGVKRMIFDEDQSIYLSKLDPEKMVGLPVMHPYFHYSGEEAAVSLNDRGDAVVLESGRASAGALWLGGFNPFATYNLELASTTGTGEIGFEFTSPDMKSWLSVLAIFRDSVMIDLKMKVFTPGKDLIANQSIATSDLGKHSLTSGKLILQMLGSGLVVYKQDQGLPLVIGQADFNPFIDLRQKASIQSFQTRINISLEGGFVAIKKAEVALTPGVGLADIRPISYENGEPLLEGGRLWYTMSIRGRALPHHLQGVFSMNPKVFDLKLEGVIVFDQDDGLLRNEIASHIFFDRRANSWRGVTTGFSAYANPDKEKKQLLIVESKSDPRFGFSVMKSRPFDMVGDIEDPSILYDSADRKWRMLACKNEDGYKAVMLESAEWNSGYRQIAGPVADNSTGTSIQRIGNELYCFSGSSDRKIHIYRYPDLTPTGTLKIDLPPWNGETGTRTWPNIVQLPQGYPFPFVALMMDRLNYPGMKGDNWSYGALYLYHGFER